MDLARELGRFQRGLEPSRKENRLLALQEVAQLARLDIGREGRKGIPEIILADGKEPLDVARIADAMVRRSGRAIVTRASKAHYRLIGKRRIPTSTVEYFPKSRIILVKSKTYRTRKNGGRLGILTAGTSDIPVAEEAKIIAEEMGCDTASYNDVGVAGLHRLFAPLTKLLKWDVDVILVVAGREGALPTVVAGMVDVPIIGVPTSRSYGFGDKGIAALAAMLQSCSLGIAVVNIDGGVGAGAVGALIANRAAQSRKAQRVRSQFPEAKV